MRTHNFFNNGTAITKMQFENSVGNDWLEKLDENFEYSSGYYKATFIADELYVNTSDFYIHEYMSGYFSIRGKIFNQNNIDVFGGDSANEDDYNKEYMEEVLENWDGKLELEGINFRIQL